jgi:hypothetical protein
VAERYYREMVAFPVGTVGGLPSAETTAALSAVTAELLPPGLALTGYQAQFRWRAAHRRGYRDLYERFAAALDRDARAAGAAGFVAANRQTQEQILARLARTRRTLLARNLAGGLRLDTHRARAAYRRCHRG